MTAIDFSIVCGGIGVLLVCVAYATKLVSDVRLRSEVTRKQAHKPVEPHDHFNERLHELRASRFSPMLPGRSTRPVSHLQKNRRGNE